MNKDYIPIIRLSLAGIIFLFLSGIAFATESKITLALIDLEVGDTLRAEQMALSNRFRSELINTAKFTVVERNKIKQLIKEQKLALMGMVDEKSAVKIGKMLGVKKIVSGSVAKVGNVFSVSARMIDVESGQIDVTADMDCDCSIEDVLVVTLKYVAQKLAGFSVPEDGFSRINRKLPETFRLEKIKTYTIPFEGAPYRGMVWNGTRLYIGLSDGMIYRINTELGANIEAVYPARNSKISALGWDGKNIWSATMGNGNLLKHKMDQNLSIDYIYRPKGRDTYPYAMAIEGKDIYTGGYSKKLKHYKIVGDTEVELINEINLGHSLSSLTIVDGRMFTFISNPAIKFVEIIGDRIIFLPGSESILSASAMTYDGKNFWLLNHDGLSKYRVVEVSKKTPDKKTFQTNVFGARFPYMPGRPVGIAWDGSKLWSLGNEGLYSHNMDASLSVKHQYKMDFSKSKTAIKNNSAWLHYGYGALAWDGKNLLALGRSEVDFGVTESYIMRLKPASNVNPKNYFQTLEVVEMGKIPLKDIDAFSWYGNYLWISSGQNTRDSGEGSFIHKIKQKLDGDWEIIKSYKAPGERCQGIALDGKNLWSYDVFSSRFYKHSLDDNLSVISEYVGKDGMRYDYFSGLAWDGKNFWTGNYRFNKVYKMSFQ